MREDTPRVEACIEAVSKRFPSIKSTAYFEEVHQHIAPLARDMERELAARDAEIADLRAALAAKAVPDGWKLVPIEPTCEMIDAFHEADDAAFAGGSQHGVGICMAWNAMLDSAPSPAEQEG